MCLGVVNQINVFIFSCIFALRRSKINTQIRYPYRRYRATTIRYRYFEPRITILLKMAALILFYCFQTMTLVLSSYTIFWTGQKQTVEVCTKHTHGPAILINVSACVTVLTVVPQYIHITFWPILVSALLKKNRFGILI